MKAIKVIVAAVCAIIAFPFILLGVAVGVVLASARAVVKAGAHVSPKSISGTSTERPATPDAQSQSPDVKIVNFNKFPFGREDRGGTC